MNNMGKEVMFMFRSKVAVSGVEVTGDARMRLFFSAISEQHGGCKVCVLLLPQ